MSLTFIGSDYVDPVAEEIISNARFPCRSMIMGTPRCVPVKLLAADSILLLCPASDLEVAAEEWEAFQDTLLNHVRKHQPVPCRGLTKGIGCADCKDLFGDKLKGAILKDRLAVFEYVYQNTAIRDFDPGGTVVYDESQDHLLLQHRARFTKGFRP